MPTGDGSITQMDIPTATLETPGTLSSAQTQRPAPKTALLMVYQAQTGMHHTVSTLMASLSPWTLSPRASTAKMSEPELTCLTVNNTKCSIFWDVNLLSPLMFQTCHVESMVLSTSLLWTRTETKEMEMNVVLNLVPDTVMLNAHMTSNSLMAKLTVLTGTHLQPILTPELESGVPAAQRWISGRPTRSQLPTLPIHAPFQLNINVKIPSHVVTTQTTDSMVFATRTVVT